MYKKCVNDAVNWYMGELGARVVAESGRPSDRYHLGKLILQGLKDDPNFVLQIDGSTGKSENFSSVLKRSVTCAHAMRSMGLQAGDVIILMVSNQLDSCIPYYAAYYIGVSIAPIDRFLQINELQDIFSIDQPKIIFCQSERAGDVRRALDNLKLNTKIVTFDKKCDKVNNCVLFNDLLKKHKGEINVSDFKASDFDPEDTVAVLISTSGTTGLPKQGAVTHKNFVVSNPNMWSRETNFPKPTKMFLILSPLQWLSAIMNYNLAPLLRYTLLMFPQNMSLDQIYYLINTYKPTFTICSPTMLTSLIAPGNRDNCDFSSFELILCGGSAVSAELLEDLKTVSPKTEIFNVYGLSEVSSMATVWNYELPQGSSGTPAPHLQFRIVNINTHEDIDKPGEPGELWIKGPSVFKGYYKNETATKEAFSKDGWFKTGDMFYRDEHWNFYFSERIKLLLKYKNHQVSPVEIQNVIRQHPGVLDVAVTGLPDPECGDLPVACVQRQPGQCVTAKEIKDLVKDLREELKRRSSLAQRANSTASATYRDFVQQNGVVPPPLRALPRKSTNTLSSTGNTLKGSCKKPKSHKLTKADIGFPVYESFRHISHADWLDVIKEFDVENPCEEMRLFLSKAGISEAQMQDFINMYRELNEVKEEPHEPSKSPSVVERGGALPSPSPTPPIRSCSLVHAGPAFCKPSQPRPIPPATATTSVPPSQPKPAPRNLLLPRPIPAPTATPSVPPSPPQPAPRNLPLPRLPPTARPSVPPPPSQLAPRKLPLPRPSKPPPPPPISALQVACRLKAAKRRSGIPRRHPGDSDH